MKHPAGAFNPKLPDASPNIPKHSLLHEFVALLMGLSLILVLLYVVLGLLIDFAVARIPPQREQTLFSQWMPELDRSKQSAAERELQRVVDAMQQRTGIVDIPLRVLIIDHAQPNAFALPGGSIGVTSGLVTGAGSENEVAMVLGHEIGHFVLRHHLRGLGRGLVVVLLSSTILGIEPQGQGLFGLPLVLASSRYSREQESAADEVGLRLLNALYGHVGGALDFFERMKSEDPTLVGAELFRSHPLSVERVKALAEYARAQAYAAREDRVPLSASLQDLVLH
ncbi:MAG: M48 family metallopeptidase [Bdellovibrionota bacterium]|nr:MAG: M48 family metallopeptidase [Bdellovibrionota bacterium]